jgi:hypothetical protein
LPFLQAPVAHAVPVRQQASPLAPQQVPFSHVPAMQAVLLATHEPFVSQQPVSVGGPLHLLPAQQTSPAAPQAWHAPAAQISFAPQVLPTRRHVLFAMQQLPPVHSFEAQHISVDPPHVVQLPFRHSLPVVLQLVLLPTQVPSAGSQHAPAAEQAGPLTQHPRPTMPQGEHAP